MKYEEIRFDCHRFNEFKESESFGPHFTWNHPQILSHRPNRRILSLSAQQSQTKARKIHTFSRIHSQYHKSFLAGHTERSVTKVKIFHKITFFFSFLSSDTVWIGGSEKVLCKSSFYFGISPHQLERSLLQIERVLLVSKVLFCYCLD